MPRSLRLSALLLASIATPASAEPVLHEYFELDAALDVELGATTEDGALPAAIQTQSGVVRAPETRTPATGPAPSPGEATYGSTTTADDGASYQIDSDTTQPTLVSYDDPFSPAIPPYKRLFAYDSVNEKFELIVSNRVLTPLKVGGSAKPEDDQFFGSMLVDLSSSAPVRIPSVGPSSLPIGAHASPPLAFELLHDGADNWYVRSKHSERVQLTLHLTIRRDVFGSEFQDVGFAGLRGYLPSLPTRVVELARAVAGDIGVDGSQRPRAIVHDLVEHFRAFTPSADRPLSQGAELYREIATSQRGVCRHRAYSFVITALGLGIPSRFVHNEAHAWVEVSDGETWHRIDLGGAAGGMAMRTTGPRHVAPRDPYAWPTGSDTAETLTAGATDSGSGGSLRSGSGTTGSGAASGAAGAHSSGSSSASPNEEEEDRASEPAQEPAPSSPYDDSSISIDSPSATSFRGGRIDVTGIIETPSNPCRHARVDLSLRDASEGELPLGTLVTDGAGRFAGKLVIPYSASLGNYSLVATTPGGPECGPGTSAPDPH